MAIFGLFVGLLVGLFLVASALICNPSIEFVVRHDLVLVRMENFQLAPHWVPQRLQGGFSGIPVFSLALKFSLT
jgi:hypothetical protein